MPKKYRKVKPQTNEIDYKLGMKPVVLDWNRKEQYELMVFNLYTYLFMYTYLHLLVLSAEKAQML